MSRTLDTNASTPGLVWQRVVRLHGPDRSCGPGTSEDDVPRPTASADRQSVQLYCRAPEKEMKRLQGNGVGYQRRGLLRAGLGAAFGSAFLLACTREPVTFKSVDITGAAYASNFRLRDQLGTIRTLADFKGRIVVVFFGFTHCPDVCPTSMLTLTEVKRLLGPQGDLVQVLFITVDPERDTLLLLKAYMANFDPGFVALRPDPDELKNVAGEFKVYYKKVGGKTPDSYSMDHSAGKYIFDTAGRVRLFSPYATEAAAIAQDIKTLLRT